MIIACTQRCVVYERGGGSTGQAGTWSDIRAGQLRLQTGKQMRIKSGEKRGHASPREMWYCVGRAVIERELRERIRPGEALQTQTRAADLR